MNQHIECYSHITGKNVKYTLIGVKLKHRKLQQDYGCKKLNYEINTSPSLAVNQFNSDIYTTSGTDAYEGELDSIYENYNVGKNPIIAASTYNVNDFEIGINTRDLFETESVKIKLVINVLKISENMNQTFVGNHSYENYIDSIIIKYTQKDNNSSLGTYRLYTDSKYIHPITFSINAELWCIKDFDPRYKRYEWNSGNDDDVNGLHVNGGPKITNKVDFVGASFSFLSSEFWYQRDVMHIYKIVKDGSVINNNELRSLVNRGDIEYYRDKIDTDPNTFMILDDNMRDGGSLPFEGKRAEWANDNLNTEEYLITSETDYACRELFGTHIFNRASYSCTPILMPCVIAGTDITSKSKWDDGEYWSLTNNILDGPAPEEPEDPEEPLEPETLELADDPETEYTPQESDGDKEFDYGEFPQMDGLEPYNLYRPSYSNFIFKKYYRTHSEDDNKDIAINFIEDATNPSAFELWGATFKLFTGRPTPGEIISRVYYLPFEYNELIGEDSAGVQLAAPVYGPVGIVTLGAKKHSEHPNSTGEPILSNIHYYTKLVNRFYVLELGNTNITRVFNNFLDFTHTSYKLTLPYGAGQIEIDPDYLFMNGQSTGNVMLRGILDLDTGELTIRVDVNRRLYYETIVNVAVDRLASVEDKMATPLAIAKMSIGAGLAAGGMSKFFGNTSQSFNSNQTYDLKNAEEVNRVQELVIKNALDYNVIKKSGGGK